MLELVKYTTSGSITLCCTPFQEPEGLRDEEHIAVEIVIADTGCGISTSKLESIFREFEQVESSQPHTAEVGVGECSDRLDFPFYLFKQALVWLSLLGSWNNSGGSFVLTPRSMKEADSHS